MNVQGDDPIPFEEPHEFPELEDSVHYLAAVKATLTPEDYCSFLKIIDAFRKQGCNFDWLKVHVKECLKDFRYLTKGFNVFLPKVHRIEVAPAKSEAVDLQTACRFLHKIKVRAAAAGRCLTGSNQILDSFLCILQNFGDSGKSLIEIYREVAFLLHNNQELLEEFTQFLPDSLNPTANVSYSSDWKSLVQLMSLAVEDVKDLPESLWSTELLLICNKVKEALNAQDYRKFLDYLKSYHNQILSSHDLQYLVGNLLSDNPTMIEEFKACVTWLAETHRPRCKRGKNGRFMREGTSLDDKMAKDLNLSHCFSCTPSYRLLPESYLNPETSKKSELEKQVLNDCWVSIASGNEDSRGAPKSSNPYAGKLFKCEDEMHQMDLLLANGSSVIDSTKRLLKKINDPSRNIKIPIRLEEHFKAMNVRCIERVYGDQGFEVLEALQKNPQRSLPVLLDRMTKQQQKWADQQNRRFPIWTEVIKENYHKSLDPQSFTKKQDSKKLKGKALLAKSEEFTDKNTAAREEDRPDSIKRKKQSSVRGETSSTGRKLTKGL